MSEPMHTVPAPAAGQLLPLEGFCRAVGMSARNVRAHQARGLLPPPVRLGRQVFYGPAHVDRLDQIKDLQRKGFNLVAISAILGSEPQQDDTERLERLLERVGEFHPDLLDRLQHHGVLSVSDQRAVRLLKPRPVRGALALHRQGVPVLDALRLLERVLDAVELSAEHLVGMINDTVGRQATRPDPSAAGTMARVQTVVTLLSETAGAVAGNIGAGRDAG